jgi:hypothetical protein
VTPPANPLVAQAVAQGHGPKVTDPAVLRKIAGLLRSAARPSQAVAS